jgi:hypothetical protein
MLSIKDNLAKFNKANQDFQMQLESVKKEAEEIKRTAQQEKYAMEKELVLIKDAGETRRATDKNNVDLIIAHAESMQNIMNGENANDNSQNETLAFQKQKHLDDLAFKDRQLQSQEHIASINKN